jgi:hypothetical protein
MKSIVIRCRDCDGFGIHRVPRPKKGLGTICQTCEGSGKETFSYKPFTGLRTRKGIEKVTKPSSGLGAIGFGVFAGPTIPYSDFLDGKVPPEAFRPVP